MTRPEEGLGLQPPYSQHFGQPSYEVCACCGFEFGNDDEPGTSNGLSFEQYLAEWLSDGCEWFLPDARPTGWSIEQQTTEARLRPRS
jgi:hypothetical protein